MNNIFLIESPLQLLNAYEAHAYFKLDNPLYIVRLSNDKINDNQILKLINYLLVKNKIIVKINSRKKNLFDILKISLIKFFFILKEKRFNKIFVGNYESGFFSLLLKKINKKKLILLDDGAKSIITQKNFSNKNNIDFFSIYDLKPYTNQNIFKNNFDKLKEKIISKKVAKQTLFLGSKLSEIGIVDEKYYINFIEKVSLYFSNNSIVYIPHREENTEKIKNIEKIKNVEIKYLDYPVEFYGINENININIVGSFYSTALYTMQNIYKCESIAFKFNYENSIHKNNINDVYSFYEKYMKVIELK